jgi:zinc protease
MPSTRPLLLTVFALATGVIQAATVAEQAVRATVSGIDLVAYPTGVKNVVTLRGALPAGDRFAPAHNIAVPTLVGEMLDQGTRRNDKFALAEKLESVGATLSFRVDGTHVTISGRCLTKDLTLVVKLLAEMLREPAFPEEELDKVKKQLAGDFRRALERPGYRAEQAFSRAIYPEGHPNHAPPTEAFLEAVERATVADLQAFHAEWYGPAAFTLVAVGDLDPTLLQREVGTAFAGWTGGRNADAPPPAPAPSAASEQVVFMADKPSVSVIWGQATGLAYRDPDALALRVGTNILGSGFTGRLMATVRDREGLTYGIHAAVMNDTVSDGDWRIVANFSPDLLGQGLASTRRELESWHRAGVTPEEVEREKSNYIGTFQVSLATTSGMAGALLASIQRGYGVAWPDELPKRISALTTDEINAALRRHVHPEKLLLIKAGTVGTP